MYWWISAASSRADGEVVAEGLLDDDPCGLRQPGIAELLDNGAEQERRDLEVEDGGLRIADGARDAFVGRGVGEIPADIGEPRGEPLEDVLGHGFAGALDAFAGVLPEVLERPVIARDTNDRAVQQAAHLQAVERAEGHHLGQVAGDAEDHEDVGGLALAGGVGGRTLSWCPCAHRPGPLGCRGRVPMETPACCRARNEHARERDDCTATLPGAVPSRGVRSGCWASMSSGH